MSVFPAVFFVDWDSAEGAQKTGEPAGPYSQLSKLFGPTEFSGFSQIMGEVLQETSAPQLDGFLYFCGPLMGIDYLNAPQIMDFQDKYAHAALSPESVVKLRTIYYSLDFFYLEPLYNNVLDSNPGYWEGDVSFTDFCKYCEVWVNALKTARDTGKQLGCYM